MTDKQVLIDGVDVNRCRFYNDRNGYCDACKDDIDGASFTKCTSEDNCYYKQKEKYKNALKEIKEIAKPYYTLGSKNSPVAQILQKINEVENAL